MNADTAFASVLSHLPNAQPCPARNGTRLYLGPQLLTLDPLCARITSRPVSPKIVAAEFIWMLSGLCASTAYLALHDVHIWDQWGTPEHDGDHTYQYLGPIYGSQWRGCWASDADQIVNAVRGLLVDPYSSRALVDAWNPEHLDQMALPPCHFAHQVKLTGGPDLYRVHLHVFQRSCDVLVGLPYNLAFYGLFTQWYAQALTANDPLKRRFEPGLLHFHISDAHIYASHLDRPQVRPYIDYASRTRTPPLDYPQWHLTNAPFLDLARPRTLSELPAPDTLLDRCDAIDPPFTFRLPAAP
jgi:thymidylate synthase